MDKTKKKTNPPVHLETNGYSQKRKEEAEDCDKFQTNIFVKFAELNCFSFFQILK